MKRNRLVVKRSATSGIKLILALACFTACKNGRQSQPSESEPQSEHHTLEIMLPVQKVDTLKATNAPNRITRKIRRGKDGNLIIAALTDVIFYDGESFTKLPKPSGVDSFESFDVLEDSNGNIWIASRYNGVYQYNGEIFTHFTTGDGLGSNQVMTILEDSRGNLWFGTSGGVSIYDDGRFNNFTTEDGLTHNEVNALMEDHTGKIWLGSRGEVCVYNPRTEMVEVRLDSGLSLKNVWSILEDSNGDIWIGGEDGLWQYDGNSYSQLSNDFVNCVFEDQQGNIWITTPSGSFRYYSRKSSYGTPVEILNTEKMLFWVMEDKDGYKWVGALNGVFRYDGNKLEYFVTL